RIYISHGTADTVLPIDRCSRRIVPALRAAGYEVTYEEFDGGHTVPPATADRAFAWWTAGAGRPPGRVPEVCPPPLVGNVAGHHGSHWWYRQRSRSPRP